MATNLPINYQPDLDVNFHISQRYSWEDFESILKFMVASLDPYIKTMQNELNVDNFHLVPISRGGNIPATRLAHELKLPINHIVAVRSYKDRIQGNVEIINFPKLKQKELASAIFVEDIIDTGETVKAITAEYPTAAFISCVGKESGIKVAEGNLIIRPPVIVNDHVWIEFPWERKFAVSN